MESGTKVDDDKNQQVESMSDSEEDEKDIAAIERSMLPIPGTNANRFSLLLDDGRSKKKSTTKESPKKKAKSSSADTQQTTINALLVCAQVRQSKDSDRYQVSGGSGFFITVR